MGGTRGQTDQVASEQRKLLRADRGDVEVDVGSSPDHDGGHCRRLPSLKLAALVAVAGLLVLGCGAASAAFCRSSQLLDRGDAKSSQASLASSGAWRLRAISTGCTNWPDAEYGDVTTEVDPDACGARCAQTAGCIGFGYQRGSCPDWRYGRETPGACSLWRLPCEDMENDYWDDYEMIFDGTAGATANTTSGPSTSSNNSAQLPFAAPTAISMGSFDIDNLDLKTLRQNHEVYKRLVLTLKQKLGAQMGVDPEDVILDFSDHDD